MVTRSIIHVPECQICQIVSLHESRCTFSPAIPCVTRSAVTWGTLSPECQILRQSPCMLVFVVFSPLYPFRYMGYMVTRYIIPTPEDLEIVTMHISLSLLSPPSLSCYLLYYTVDIICKKAKAWTHSSVHRTFICLSNVVVYGRCFWCCPSHIKETGKWLKLVHLNVGSLWCCQYDGSVTLRVRYCLPSC